MLGYFLLVISVLGSANAGVLQVTSGHLTVGGQRVFLSGPNIAWKSYGYDFGNNQYDNSGPILEGWLQSISDAGGNCIRIWLHVEGDNTPEYNGDGYVTAPDRTGSLFSDMRKFLDAAEARNILVIFALWNGALMRNEKTKNLVWDDKKLQSYIDNVLKPMATSLAGHRALGSWEIMNEPEGSVIPQGHADPCADSSSLEGTGANWSGGNIPMYRIQTFINWQADALRSVDPSTLITLGTWSELSASDTLGRKNFYTDECLKRIGGRAGGYLDFYQIHTYAHGGAFNPTSPFKHSAGEFSLDKPLIIGEFSSVCSENNHITEMFDHLYNNGYQGGLTWMYEASGDCTDTQNVQREGFDHIRGYNDQSGGGLVNIDV